MSPIDRRLENAIGFHPRMPEAERRRREVVLKVAEVHFTACEFAGLIDDVAMGRIDIRIYDDGIVLMRQF